MSRFPALAPLRARNIRLVILAATCAVSALAHGVHGSESNRPRVVAHRGLLRHAPENTLAGFRACLELRIGFEFDVARTRDGHLVCIHDDTVDRTTNGSGRVSEMTLAEVRALDAGSWFNTEFSNEKVPTVDEVLSLVGEYRQHDVLIAADLKAVNVGQDVVKLAQQHGVLERLLFIGRTISEPDLRRQIKASSAGAATATVANNESEFPTALSDEDSDWTYVRYLPSPQEMDAVHQAGRRAFIAGATVAGNLPANWQRAARAGVDGILTDYPLALTEQLNREFQAVPETQIVRWLRELKPLSKTHYSWPLPFRSISDDVLCEYVRLTHAASLSGEWGTQEQIDRAVEVCHRVNQTAPATPASIGINYSVWHRRFGKDLPPTDTGPTHQAELDYLRARMTAIRDGLAQANDRHGADIRVSAILFDSEHFHVKPQDAKWNAAITQKYDASWDIVREIFPNVRIEWYARGAVHPGASATGWSAANYFALDEKGESFGCSLYQVPEIGQTREIFRRTAKNAAHYGCDEVTPWIALASGYRRQTDQYHEFSLNWNYDLIYSWQLGRELHNSWFGVPERAERFAPWNKAKVAIFYPEPFGRSRFWGQHFVAYVRGAAGVQEIGDLQSD